MVLPSVDTTQNQWPRKQGSTDTPAKKRNEPISPASIADDNSLPINNENGKNNLQPLPEEAFDLNHDESPLTPDFALELTTKTPATENTESPAAVVETPVYPEEARHGRKRPPLPFTFAFGIRRPMTVAVMMRHPILGADAPENRIQAIQDTLDLAATNRLPYQKGAQLSLVA